LLNVLFNPFAFQKRFQYFTVKQSETLINSPVLVVFISHKEATRKAPHDSLVNLMNNRSEKCRSITATADFSTIANVMHLPSGMENKRRHLLLRTLLELMRCGAAHYLEKCECSFNTSAKMIREG
jgi:hypothetical protein